VSVSSGKAGGQLTYEGCEWELEKLTTFRIIINLVADPLNEGRHDRHVEVWKEWSSRFVFTRWVGLLILRLKEDGVI
jgi:hypothetical protein